MQCLLLQLLHLPQQLLLALATLLCMARALFVLLLLRLLQPWCLLTNSLSYFLCSLCLAVFQCLRHHHAKPYGYRWIPLRETSDDLANLRPVCLEHSHAILYCR